MRRRDFVRNAGFLVGMAAATCGRSPVMAGLPVGERIRLWPGTPPGGGGPVDPELVNDRGAVSNIPVPLMEVFRPVRPNGTAVLVAAGGGYRQINLGSEGDPAGRWLSRQGVTAYVLHYRLPGEGWRAGPMAPLQDAQRALRLIRAGGMGGPPPARVGLLGFSAGGHLLGMAAARPTFASYPPIDRIDRLSARPDQAALIYPIVTIEPPYDHTQTRIQLVGRHPTPAEYVEWSVQTYVTSQCPPMFLVQAENDPISNIANTAILAAACRKAGVAVERHVLPSGGHGFGMGEPGTPTGEWPGWYGAWLERAP